MEYTVYRQTDRPDLFPQTDRINAEAWSSFAQHHPVTRRWWGMLYSRFPAFQLVLVGEEDRALAIANAVPLRWDGTIEDLPAGWDAALEQGCTSGEPPDTLCALAAAVSRDHARQGLGVAALRAMGDAARAEGLQRFIAPVSPSLKHRYPLTPMERYMTWRLPDGRAFDPWIRSHEALGARLLVAAPESMRIRGTVAEWEEWTGMAFPESGQYIIPSGKAPLQIDRERDEGVCLEPDVWMEHRIG